MADEVASATLYRPMSQDEMMEDFRTVRPLCDHVDLCIESARARFDIPDCSGRMINLHVELWKRELNTFQEAWSKAKRRLDARFDILFARQLPAHLVGDCPMSYTIRDNTVPVFTLTNLDRLKVLLRSDDHIALRLTMFASLRVQFGSACIVPFFLATLAETSTHAFSGLNYVTCDDGIPLSGLAAKANRA